MLFKRTVLSTKEKAPRRTKGLRIRVTTPPTKVIRYQTLMHIGQHMTSIHHISTPDTNLAGDVTSEPGVVLMSVAYTLATKGQQPVFVFTAMPYPQRARKCTPLTISDPLFQDAPVAPTILQSITEFGAAKEH